MLKVLISLRIWNIIYTFVVSKGKGNTLKYILQRTPLCRLMIFNRSVNQN